MVAQLDAFRPRHDHEDHEQDKQTVSRHQIVCAFIFGVAELDKDPSIYEWVKLLVYNIVPKKLSRIEQNVGIPFSVKATHFPHGSLPTGPLLPRLRPGRLELRRLPRRRSAVPPPFAQSGGPTSRATQRVPHSWRATRWVGGSRVCSEARRTSLVEMLVEPHLVVFRRVVLSEGPSRRWGPMTGQSSHQKEVNSSHDLTDHDHPRSMEERPGSSSAETEQVIASPRSS